jgi:hypothetical protein
MRSIEPSDLRLDTVGPFCSLGRCWTLQSDSLALPRLVADLFAPTLTNEVNAQVVPCFRVIECPPPGAHALYRDDHFIVRRGTAGTTIESLLWAITRLVIEGDRVHPVVHAAAAARDGDVLLLPAPPEGGKSTLVMALLDRGWSYLTDEAVMIVGERQALGFAKPITLDRGSWSEFDHHRPTVRSDIAPYFLHQWHLAAAGFANVQSGGRIRLIAFPSYRPGAPTAAYRLQQSAALRDLVERTFAAEGSGFSRRHLRTLLRLVAAVPSYSVTTGDLHQACETLETLFDSAA